MRLMTAFVLLLLSVQAFAVNLTQEFKPGETLRYKVAVKMTGKALVPGESAPVAIDSAFELVVKVKYLKDRSTPNVPSRMTLEAENAVYTVGGSRLNVGKEIFPDLTFMLDSSGDIIRVIPPDDVLYRLPGINYRNMVLLMRTYAPAGDLKPSDSWKKVAKIVGGGDPLDFKCRLESIETKPEDAQFAKIKSDLSIMLPSDSSCKADGTAVCDFSLPLVRLERAHVDMKTRWIQDKTKTSDKQSDQPVVVATLDISRMN